jgi:hypothetical protein
MADELLPTTEEGERNCEQQWLQPASLEVHDPKKKNKGQ